MICGSKWKSCECPWFSFETPEEDRLDMLEPMPLDWRGLERLEEHHAAGRGPWAYEPGVVPNMVRQRAMSYDDELAMKRLQERQEGDVSRRRRQRDRHLHHRRHGEVEVEVEEDDDDYQVAHDGDLVSSGNTAAHLMNDEYRRGPQHIYLPPSPPPAAPAPPPQPFKRPTVADVGGGDYLIDVGRVRGGPQQSSVERRLVDRLSEFRPVPPAGGSPVGVNPMMGAPAPPPPPPLLPGPMLRMPPMAPPLPMMPMMRRPMMDGPMGYGSPPPRLVGASLSDPSGMVASGEYGREETRRFMRRGGPHERPRSSMLAGLSGIGRGMARVSEWRSHVEPGEPEDATR